MQLDRNRVGAVIRRLRKERRLSQEVLSGLAGISRTHLTWIENGRKLPNLETLWKISGALNIRPNELIRKIEEDTEHTEL